MFITTFFKGKMIERIITAINWMSRPLSIEWTHSNVSLWPPAVFPFHSPVSWWLQIDYTERQWERWSTIVRVAPYLLLNRIMIDDWQEMKLSRRINSQCIVDCLRLLVLNKSISDWRQPYTLTTVPVRQVEWIRLDRVQWLPSDRDNEENWF